MAQYTPPLPQVCHHNTYRQMLGSHIMLFDTSMLCLRYRSFNITEIRQCTRTTKQIISLLTSNILQLHTIATTHFGNPNTTNNNVDYAPVILSIFNVDSVFNVPTKLLNPSPKTYKHLLSNTLHHHPACSRQHSRDSTSTHTKHSQFSLSKWSSFWRLPIPLRSRIIWFKIIHNTIPHTKLLHLCNPQRFPSPLCPLCSTEPDSLIHFFYTCTKIQPVWITIATLFIHQNWQHAMQFFLADVSSAISNFSTFPPRDPSFFLPSSLSSSQIVACVLQAIWTVRWQFIFQASPFLSNNISSQSQKIIYQLDAEITLNRDL